MMIRAYDKNDVETLLPMVRDTLIRSMADDDICPVLTLGLYAEKEQSKIVEDTMDRKMMVNILKKYFSRWHPMSKRWKTGKVVKLMNGFKDESLDIMITTPRGVQDFLKANSRKHKIEPPRFFFLWDMDPRKVTEGVIEHTMIITDISDTGPRDVHPHQTTTEEWV